jgi:DNA-binding response OmpR family regulator
VREILELNHCEIRVESEPGAGSTFRFVLPLASERTGMLPTRGRRRVVIVDDDAGFVQRLAAHLSGRGWVVETAAGTEPGWATIRRVRPHAVVLDRLLPDGDGFDLLERLQGRSSTRRIPVLLVTIRAERALGLRLGAAAYLRKPIDAEELERRLEEVVGEAAG